MIKINGVEFNINDEIWGEYEGVDCTLKNNTYKVIGSDIGCGDDEFILYAINYNNQLIVMEYSSFLTTRRFEEYIGYDTEGEKIFEVWGCDDEWLEKFPGIKKD